jgi:hypothetical protein
MATVNLDQFARYRAQPTLGSSLSGIAQSINSYSDRMRQNKLSDIALQQNEMKTTQMQQQAKEEEDYKRRIAEYQRIVLQNPMMSQEEKIALRDRLFSKEMLESNIKDPFESRRLDIREKEAGVREMTAEERAEENLRKEDRFKTQSQLQKEKLENDTALRKERLLFQREEAERRAGRHANADRIKEERLKISADRLALQTEKHVKDYAWKTEGKWDKEDAELLQEISPLLQKYKKEEQDLTPKGVHEILTATTDVNSLLNLTQKLEKEIEKYSTFSNIKGSDKEAMKTLVATLIASLNSDAFYKAGVLQAGDLEMITQIIGNPTDFFRTKEEARAKLNGAEDFIESKIVSHLEARGIKGRDAYNEMRKNASNFFEESSRYKNKGTSKLLDEDDETLLRESGF